MIGLDRLKNDKGVMRTDVTRNVNQQFQTRIYLHMGKGPAPLVCLSLQSSLRRKVSLEVNAPETKNTKTRY